MKIMKNCKTILFLLGFALSHFLHPANAVNKKTSKPALAPGYGTLEFIAPQPGTYQLPILGSAADGEVIDSTGKTINLHSLMGDKIVLLSFIYSTCNDVNGCPLATAVFHRIKRRLKKDPELAKQLRMLTLSFDPAHDTPEQMQKYGASLQEEDLEWQFLTTGSEKTLQPILDAYQQNIQKQYDDQGQFLGTYAHILRVFLIDRNKKFRNIYNVSFLHPDTLINDIKTVLLADAATDKKKISVAEPVITAEIPRLYAPGDDKKQYHQTDYTTNSIALTDRLGQKTDLLRFAEHPPLGLPAVPVPADNPLTAEKINLGRKLFYDRRLSLNNTFSCAMCHIPEQGFTSNEVALAVGIEGRTVRRNSPTVYNVAYLTALFHDGRENTLEQQVWAPLLAVNEMGNPSIGYVLAKIKNSVDYQGMFEQAFDKGPSMETVGMAIASYERTLNSANSAFDQWHFGKQKRAISKTAKQGYQLFQGKAGCANCHTIAADNALFTDNLMHNTGVGYRDSMIKDSNKQRVQVAPGIFVDVDYSIIEAVSEPKANDLGLYEITQSPADRWKYRTPSLRNIALTAPYMHNGEFASLKQVIGFYNQGGVANENLDELIKPLHLNDNEIAALVEFLNALTGDNVNLLVSDAFAAPIGDPN
jgi:cytochrome c peroxidase